MTDAERMEVARELALQVDRREPPDPDLIAPGAEFSGGLFAVGLGHEVPIDLRSRLEEIAAADFPYRIAFHACYAAPGERVVLTGLTTRPHDAQVAAAVYSFRGRQVSHVEALRDPAEAFARVGLTYPPTDDVPRLGRPDEN